MRSVLVIRIADGSVINAIVLDGEVPAATDQYRFVAAEGVLASAGIGWTVSVDGVGTPPPVPDPVDDAAAIAAQLAELQARLEALQAANGGPDATD